MSEFLLVPSFGKGGYKKANAMDEIPDHGPGFAETVPGQTN